ncbi:hypothetical protein SAMN03092900_0898 [Thiomicrospira sp. ALE5]|nr:hypothetical protein SAMN03092900_0898 [Thiomicrospira sp. ALE5]
MPSQASAKKNFIIGDLAGHFYVVLFVLFFVLTWCGLFQDFLTKRFIF